MDIISRKTMEEFSKENGLTGLKESEQFEHLAAFVCLRRHYSRAFNTADVVVGKGSDTGLDAIAIIVNGTLITDVDTVRELYEQNGYVEAAFVFVQAERSENFDSAKIGTTTFGVLDFFKEKPDLPRTEAVERISEIKDAVFALATKFKRNPACHIYYMTTGKQADSAEINARRENGRKDILNTQMFESVDFYCLGALDLQRLYRQTRTAVERSFAFKEKVPVPQIAGVKESWLGYVPVGEFIKIISDDAGDGVLGNIFYDNVRDWQDYNDVNSEIRKTLESAGKSRFVLMNNGVTIIAKKLKQTAGTVTIEDFQIVNGCQTSHVIFDQRDKLKEDASVCVPLRLIETDDEAVISEIIKATNSQTELTREQLYSLQDFPKLLESYFEAAKGPSKLYYERRDGQYDRLPIAKNLIASPKVVIRAFAAMFLGEPHTATKNYKSLRERIGKEIFAEDHRPAPYYVAAYTSYRLEQEYNSHRLHTAYRAARYHILLAGRLLMDPQPTGWMNKKDLDKRCEKMLEVLWDQDKSEALFQDARRVIDEVSGNNLDRDNIRTEATTAAIFKALAAKQGS